jgi:hypothetical protein
MGINVMCTHLCMVLAVTASAAALESAVDVHGFVCIVQLCIIVAFVRVSVAIARLAHEHVARARASPRFLFETGTASIALVTARVVLATTQHAGHK